MEETLRQTQRDAIGDLSLSSRVFITSVNAEAIQVLSLLRSRGTRYLGSDLEQVGTHQVYIIHMNDGTKRVVKVIYTEDIQAYEDKYKDLEYLGLVPGSFDFINAEIDANGLMHTALLVVNEYIHGTGKIEWILDLIDSLHAAGYIHGDVTEPSNIVFDGEKALFLDIDSVFHVDNIDSADIDFEDVYGTRDPEKIMASERRVLERRVAKSRQ